MNYGAKLLKKNDIEQNIMQQALKLSVAGLAASVAFVAGEVVAQIAAVAVGSLAQAPGHVGLLRYDVVALAGIAPHVVKLAFLYLEIDHLSGLPVVAGHTVAQTVNVGSLVVDGTCIGEVSQSGIVKVYEHEVDMVGVFRGFGSLVRPGGKHCTGNQCRNGSRKRYRSEMSHGIRKMEMVETV